MAGFEFRTAAVIGVGMMGPGIAPTRAGVHAGLRGLALLLSLCGAVCAQTLRLVHHVGVTIAPSEAQASVSSQSVGGAQVNASVSTRSGGAWLGVRVVSSVASITGPATFSVFVTAVGLGLPVGEYHGELVLKSKNALTFPVVYQVCALPPVTVSPAEFAFSYRMGDPQPQPLSLKLAARDSDPYCFGANDMRFKVSATTDSGGGWLVAPGTELNPIYSSAATVGIDSDAAAAGAHRGTLTVWCSSCTKPTVSASASVTADIVPVSEWPTIDAVVSAASFLEKEGIGSWIAIFGRNLAPASREWNNDDFKDGVLPRSLDGVSVNMNPYADWRKMTFYDQRVAISYVSPNQVNALLPLGTGYGTGTQVRSNQHVRVTTGLRVSEPRAIQVAHYEPAFFVFPVDDRLYAVAVFPDGTLAGRPGPSGEGAHARRPLPGERVQLYGAGFGNTTPPVDATRLIAEPRPIAAIKYLKILIGGVPATIEYAGLVASGLWQFNVVVPKIAAGDQPVVAAFDVYGQPVSRSDVYLTIGP